MKKNKEPLKAAAPRTDHSMCSHYYYDPRCERCRATYGVAPEVANLVLGHEEYVRGLHEAAMLVSQESGRRREAGEMEAYYALNAVWHVIQRIAEEASKASARKRPQKEELKP